MRVCLIVALGALLAVLPLSAEEKSPYTVKFKVGEPRVFNTPQKQGIYVTIRFTVTRPDGIKPSDSDAVVITEDGKEVARLPIENTEVQNLNTVLALDVSGSMAAGTPRKIDAAKSAAGVFLDMLNDRADTGLILFDHEVPLKDATRVLRPSGNPKQYLAQAVQVRNLIDNAKPLGGTAYLDATDRALDMLIDLEGRKAVLLMTDGVDMNSKKTLDEVLKKAKVAEIPVYTLGIGEKGLNERVTTVLVLDHSGSMSGRANDTDADRKIDALHKAATQFVELMRPSAQTTLLPFSSDVESPGPFTNDKRTLAGRIRALKPDTGTSLYDATLAGVETLVAANPPGKKAVVVLTDGKDESPGSRYSDQAVIERAKEAKIPLYMLGLGRKREINEPVMRRMAQETGGEYFYAGSAQKLIELFEKLSIDLHDDGIDEESLRQLAKETGGEYHHVRDVSQLKIAFQEVARNMKEMPPSVEVKSLRDRLDGTARIYDVYVERGGTRISEKSKDSESAVVVRGLVVPEQAPFLYLGILGGIVGLLAIPAVLRALNGTGRVR